MSIVATKKGPVCIVTYRALMAKDQIAFLLHHPNVSCLFLCQVLRSGGQKRCAISIFASRLKLSGHAFVKSTFSLFLRVEKPAFQRGPVYAFFLWVSRFSQPLPIIKNKKNLSSCGFQVMPIRCFLRSLRSFFQSGTVSATNCQNAREWFSSFR